MNVSAHERVKWRLIRFDQPEPTPCGRPHVCAAWEHMHHPENPQQPVPIDVESKDPKEQWAGDKRFHMAQVLRSNLGKTPQDRGSATTLGCKARKVQAERATAHLLPQMALPWAILHHIQPQLAAKRLAAKARPKLTTLWNEAVLT